MKKILLTMSVLAVGIASANAQRVTLWEEFTGENCPPCASTNPGLWTKYQANTAKAIMIKYQVPIPSAGPIYLEYTTDATARDNYYTITSAPGMMIDGQTCCMNGSTPSRHPAYLAQPEIDAYAAVAAPFTIVTDGRWSKNNDSLYAKVTIKAPAAYNQSTANLKLRIAFVQNLHFATAPGTNGEKNFENVVRKMIPDATGTALNNTWTANEEKTFEIGVKVPTHLKKKDMGFFVAWIQNETDKKVLMADPSPETIFPSFIPVVGNTIGEASIFPNPANNMANVLLTVAKTVIAAVNVTDMSGRVVYAEPQMELLKGTNQFSIPTSNFANGIYNVTIQSAEGTTTQRFSVAR